MTGLFRCFGKIAGEWMREVPRFAMVRKGVQVDVEEVSR